MGRGLAIYPELGLDVLAFLVALKPFFTPPFWKPLHYGILLDTHLELMHFKPRQMEDARLPALFIPVIGLPHPLLGESSINFEGTCELASVCSNHIQPRDPAFMEKSILNVEYCSSKP